MIFTGNKYMTQITIENCIPHRGRMKLIEEIIEVNDDGAITASTPTSTWPLCSEEGVNPIIAIELVAQTAGVQEGFKKFGVEQLGGSGWIVGIKEAQFHVSSIPLNSRLITRAHKSFEVDILATITGSVSLDGKEIASVVLQAVKGY
jgi:predicted hotdog family 3-hydroxylacyl-ACP dehydratase